MRERIESKHVTKEVKSQMPVIPVEIVKERGCTFCPYYLGNYEKQPRCMMKTCAWDDENERFHPVLRELIPFYKEKMEKAEEKFLAMKKIYTTLLGMFADFFFTGTVREKIWGTNYYMQWNTQTGFLQVLC